MHVVVAIDSFKGSLSTFQAGAAIEEGIKKVCRDAQVYISPLADGGEGTVEAVVAANDGEMQTVTVTGPLGTPIVSSYGYIPQTKTAVIEMSAAAGITLISEKERNPLYTTTYGVGELILDAIEKGCCKFIIGIGGSVTNDGGVGMLQALGFSFSDADGNEIPQGARGLELLDSICTEQAHPALRACSFCVACDVTNPLCGENGCSAIYGPQKGATPEMIEKMDTWLGNYAEMTKRVLPAADAHIPGTGAAGGMGYALLAYLNAQLSSGVDLVIRETGLEAHMPEADFVITGEGRLDGQSYMGKAPIGVARLAKKYNKPVVAFSGCVTEDAVLCNAHGIDAFFPIVRKPCSLQEAMDCENAYKNLRDTVEQAFRLICASDTKK